MCGCLQLSSSSRVNTGVVISIQGLLIALSLPRAVFYVVLAGSNFTYWV